MLGLWSEVTLTTDLYSSVLSGPHHAVTYVVVLPTLHVQYIYVHTCMHVWAVTANSLSRANDYMHAIISYYQALGLILHEFICEDFISPNILAVDCCLLLWVWLTEFTSRSFKFVRGLKNV